MLQFPRFFEVNAQSTMYILILILIPVHEDSKLIRELGLVMYPDSLAFGRFASKAGATRWDRELASSIRRSLL